MARKSPFEQLLQISGIAYTIRRKSSSDRTELGVYTHEESTHRAYVAFRPETDVAVGDTLIDPVGEIVYVVETQVGFLRGKPYNIRAFCQTESELQEKKKSLQPVFNIQHAYGSVIGISSNAVINYDASVQQIKEQIAASDSPDKDDMEKIISLLEMIVNDEIRPSKGVFSKFKDTLERNSWLSSSVASTILSWLMSQIP